MYSGKGHFPSRKIFRSKASKSQIANFLTFKKKKKEIFKTLLSKEKKKIHILGSGFSYNAGFSFNAKGKWNQFYNCCKNQCVG